MTGRGVRSIRLVRLLAAALGLASLTACGAGTSGPEVRPVTEIGGWRPEGGPDSSYERGKRHLQHGRYGLAIADFRAALAREGADTDILNGLAIAYAELGRDELSVRYFQRALELAPSSVATLNNIGFAALRRGRLELARLYLGRALGLSRGDQHVANNWAMLASVEAIEPDPERRWEPAAPEPLPPARIQRVTPLIQRIATRPRTNALHETKDVVWH
jgi:hypothetical protein